METVITEDKSPAIDRKQVKTIELFVLRSLFTKVTNHSA